MTYSLFHIIKVSVMINDGHVMQDIIQWNHSICCGQSCVVKFETNSSNRYKHIKTVIGLIDIKGETKGFTCF